MQNQNTQKHKMMTETPVPELILKLSVPTIISMLVTAFYNMADTFFVGQISTAATAAVGLVFPVMAIVQALGFFFGQGSGSFLSRMLGAGEKKKADEMASTGFVLAVILGVVVAVLGNILATPIAYKLGATTTNIKATESYMRIILCGAPFMMGQFVVNNQLRFQGSAIYAMAGLMVGAVINVALDPILIFGCNLGVKGAAIATISGQFASFVVLIIGSRKGENITMHIKHVRFSLYYIKEIINGGAPSLFRQGLAAAATILMNHAAGEFGQDAAIAAMSIVSRFAMVLGSALIGFGQGYQPVCSYNYGAKLYKRVREGFFFCVKWGTLFLTFLAVLSIIYSPQIIRIFRNDPKVIEIGAKALRLQALALPLMGVIVLTNMMLQSIGKGIRATITSSARSGIFFIPIILILPKLFGIWGVMLAQPVADVCSVAISIPFAHLQLKELEEVKA